jgi:hypothetical protein
MLAVIAYYAQKSVLLNNYDNRAGTSGVNVVSDPERYFWN